MIIIFVLNISYYKKREMREYGNCMLLVGFVLLDFFPFALFFSSSPLFFQSSASNTKSEI